MSESKSEHPSPTDSAHSTPVDPATRGEITALLQSVAGGEAGAFDRLLPMIYEELHRMAAGHLRRERADHTLQATALVNEAYLRLVNLSQVQWTSRGHFLAVAARAMRRILVDHARTKSRQKRSAPGDRVAYSEDEQVLAVEESLAANVDLIALDEALERLGAVDERKLKVVEMRFFAGMTIEETATALNVGAMTVKRDWEFARLWLLREMTDDERDHA